MAINALGRETLLNRFMVELSFGFWVLAKLPYQIWAQLFKKNLDKNDFGNYFFCTIAR
jgi:hypothetical protein